MSQYFPDEDLDTPFGAAVQVPIQLFITKVLPPLRSEIKFEAMLNNVGKKNARRTKNRLPVTQNGCLWGYSRKKPSEAVHRRDKQPAFRSLRMCAQKLCRAVKGLKPRLEFRNDGKLLWDLCKRRKDTLPDAYLVVDPGTSEESEWARIAIPGVYNKCDTKDDAEENIIKITRCMSQCVRRDPRRRFMYGFTAEDSTMRLWYWDRAQILASEPFDFTKDWRTLFQFLLSVMFAEHHQVGYDPTITVIKWDEDDVQCEIAVQTIPGEEHRYRTLQPLSGQEQEYLIGRGTRVWKVIRIEDGHEVGEPVVLKEAWVDSHREREGFIQSRIRAAGASTEYAEALKKALVTVLCHGDVFVDGAQDATRSLSEHDPSNVDNAADDSDLFGKRQVHYRIVFKEVGTPLHDVTSLATVYKALGDVTYGLKALHMCGWVHGDISTGNILVCDRIARIADFEYATQKDERKQHDRIGTHHFLPVEVRSHWYMFEPDEDRQKLHQHVSPLPMPSISLDPSSPGNEAAEKAKTDARSSSRVKPLVFLYNPLHDLESLWWISVYFLVCKEYDNDKSSDTPEEAANRAAFKRKLASDLFWVGDNRSLTLRDRYCFPKEISQLLHPGNRIGLLLDELRISLVQAYASAEEDVENIGFDIAGGLYAQYDDHEIGISDTSLSDTGVDAYGKRHNAVTAPP
ncbi:hypothetical protein NM688_g130 [Phlebia brevispora]|uniref:Uncharacterized protein n=1 Tax=Phlebia brevispora TaxID=194682 RepID=A0ACC1TFH7_9APHY|nr:hypothetical protein NM688_g130 [Phlebia brevispora]